MFFQKNKIESLQGKVILITGGSSGIGFAAAKQLKKLGATVAISASNKTLLQTKATSIGVFAIAADVTNEKSVRDMLKQVYEHFGRIDVLINNAGRGYESPLALVDTDKLEYLFKLHVVGPLVAMQTVLPLMRKCGGGRIINVSTPTAKMPIPGLGAYSTTKAALRHMSSVARKEFAKDAIVVSTFYPFITKTNFGNNIFSTGIKNSPLINNDTMPDPDTAEFAASRLILAITSDKGEFEARNDIHFLIGILKKKLKKLRR